MRKESDIRVVVGLDFGTTYSGFAYCHLSNPQEIIINSEWQNMSVQVKTNTVLQYDYEYNNVISWGLPALAKKPNRRSKNKDNSFNRPIELFKLHLSDLSDQCKLKLLIEYKKAITDYLREIGKV